MSALIQQLTGLTLTSPGLKMYRDGLWNNAGSLYVFDSLDSYSLNGLPVGAISAGQQLANLIQGGSPATFELGGTGPGTITENAAGSGFTITPTNASWDVGRNYDLSTSQHAFLATCWFKPGPQTTNHEEVIQSFNGASFANIQYCLAWNPSTLALIGNVGASSVSTAAEITSGVNQQVGIAWYVSGGIGYIQIFKNGQLVGTQASGVPTTLPEPDAGTYAEGFGFCGLGSTVSKVGTLLNAPATSLTWLRSYKEDLTISAAASGNTLAVQAAQQVLADWNANHARFGI